MTLKGMMSAKARWCALTLLVLAAIVVPTGRVAAQEASAPTGLPTFTLGLDAAFATMDQRNVHFGAGLLAYPPKKDVAWVEAYLAPMAKMNWDLAEYGNIYGALRVVASATQGDGDGWGATYGEPSKVNIDHLYAGWKSGDTFASLGKNAIDISVGRQPFQLWDGMILFDPVLDSLEGWGAYNTDPRHGWLNGAVARANIGPTKTNLFWLRSGESTGHDRVLGGSFDLADEKMGTVGVSYIDVLESKLVNHDGMKVMGAHARGKPIAAMPVLELGAEYQHQSNDSPKISADGWFADMSFLFWFLPWYPTLGYRYSSFSGDKASTSTIESWDPLYFGGTEKGFGYWYQGMVVGNSETWPTNLDTHFFNLTLVPPVPGMWAKVLFYDHHFNDTSKAAINGSAVSSDMFATEWDFVVGYSPSKTIDLVGVWALASPGVGGKERVGGFDRTESLLELLLLIHF